VPPVKSVIVIGAGFAGLAAALELARRGSRVTVLESHAVPGGRAQRIVTPSGYAFDSGPTLLVMVDALRRALGEEAFAALGLRRLEPGYRVMWPDGERFDVSSNLAELLDEVARFEGFEHRGRMVEYLADVHEQYVQARAKILEVDHTPFSFARALLSRGKFAPWSLGGLRRFASGRFDSGRLIQALTFQSLYLGTSPLRAPAMYALLAVEEIVGGVWYAPGGTGAIVDAMVRECERAGVAFEYGVRVERVLSAGKRALGVVCRGEAIPADGVVVTADREPALRALFDGPLPKERHPRYGHSAALLYLGLDVRVDLPHHTVLLPDDPWAAYAALDRGELPGDPLVYVCNPAAGDPSVAPEGHAALMLLAPVPNANALPSFDEAAYRERILARVERQTGPLRRHVRYEQSRTPQYFASALHLQHGAAFGPDHRLDQMGPFRPSIRHPQIANVVFAGSGTRPGSGVPMVLISGRLAAERLSETLA
jgi:phytoene desaturase